MDTSLRHIVILANQFCSIPQMLSVKKGSNTCLFFSVVDMTLLGIEYASFSACQSVFLSQLNMKLYNL